MAKRRFGAWVVLQETDPGKDPSVSFKAVVRYPEEARKGVEYLLGEIADLIKGYRSR